MSNEIIVTVYCLAYNHEKYIRDALEGFVMQKTNFKYEVLIHDDASTDGTTEIIKEYAKRYSFIKPIYQKENQYSKGVSIAKEYMFPNIRGKYVAFCEGDDYWIDCNKLQMMVDIMEQNPNCSMCCHAYQNVHANNGNVVGTIRTLCKDGVITPEIAIEYKNPPQLASQMFRREIVVERPEIYWNTGVGDYPLLLFAAVSGDMYYLSNVMAVHRVEADGSWTQRIYNNPELRCKHFSQMKNFLNIFDKYYKYEYHHAVEKRLELIALSEAIAKHDYLAIKNSNAYKENVSLKRKILVAVGIPFPCLAQMIEKIMR